MDRHPSTFTDYELDRLASVSFLPEDFDEIAFCYERGGVLWACFRWGSVWVRGPVPSTHPLADPK